MKKIIVFAGFVIAAMVFQNQLQAQSTEDKSKNNEPVKAASMPDPPKAPELAAPKPPVQKTHDQDHKDVPKKNKPEAKPAPPVNDGSLPNQPAKKED